MPTPSQLGTHLQMLEVLAVVIARRSGDSQEIGRLFEQLAQIALRMRPDALDTAWGEECVQRIAGLLAAEGEAPPRGTPSPG